MNNDWIFGIVACFITPLIVLIWVKYVVWISNKLGFTEKESGDDTIYLGDGLRATITENKTKEVKNNE